MLRLNGVGSDGARKKRRRPRVSAVCDSCRTRKVKCDQGYPCTSCTQHSFTCSYTGKRCPSQAGSAIPSDVSSTISRPNLTQQSSLPRATALRSPDEERSEFPSAVYADIPTPDHSIPHASPVPLVERTDDGANQPQQDTDGLGEVNRHTEGSEFYGPTGTFYFLSRLQSQAKSQQPHGVDRSASDQSPNRALTNTSVVNLLHSSDYPLTRTNNEAGISHRPSVSSVSSVGHAATETEVARECVQLYFQNLHCIHPILDREYFLSRCEGEVWNNTAFDTTRPTATTQARHRFLALFNAVLAIGAITAGETSMLTWDRTVRFLDQHEGQERDRSGTTAYPPIRAARLFFERSKSYLGDIFESSSFETAQTLFLMAIFCQNALKPHSCYMYSGMALRTAFAIGLPTKNRSTTNSERLMWWGLYSHEIEMCLSAGRQSFLQEPSHYSIPLPNVTAISGPSLYLIKSMVDLAGIVRNISYKTCRSEGRYSLQEDSTRSLELDARLVDWKSRLPQQLNLETLSLDEAELVTRQKVVLKLRFWNARVLLHRPFLMAAAATESDRERLSVHIMACVEAAQESIRFIYNIYLHRPYFRTWWYNCTYVLDSSMVLLYVLLSDVYSLSPGPIFGDIEKSLEIFRSMKTLAVARRCADITREALNIARKLCRDRQRGLIEQSSVVDPVPSLDHLLELMPDVGGRMEDGARGDGDPGLFLNGLVDSNLMLNFLNFEDWDAWSWQQ